MLTNVRNMFICCRKPTNKPSVQTLIACAYISRYIHSSKLASYDLLTINIDYLSVYYFRNKLNHFFPLLFDLDFKFVMNYIQIELLVSVD